MATTPAPSPYTRAEHRIARMTLWIGLPAAVAAAAAFSWRAGAGVAVGTLLAWINQRWMRQSLDLLVTVPASQAGAARPRIPLWNYLRFFARYALIALVAYVMFSAFAIPVVSLLGGLLALGAAAMVQGITEAVQRSN